MRMLASDNGGQGAWEDLVGDSRERDIIEQTRKRDKASASPHLRGWYGQGSP